jgi:4-hydroxyphenylacetate decarboxylase small subunit
MQGPYKHSDCQNYAPVDVAKGICHARKELVLADGETCELFERVPKCKHCEKYSPGEEEYLGFCNVSPNQPMTYPDLIGITCEWFSWKEA